VTCKKELFVKCFFKGICQMGVLPSITKRLSKEVTQVKINIEFSAMHVCS